MISIQDLHNFTSKSIPIDSCHSIMKECLYLIECCKDKEAPQNPNAESRDIPSSQMRLNFSQFKNIVLNQGFVIRDDPAKMKPNQMAYDPTSANKIMNSLVVNTKMFTYKNTKEEYKSPKLKESILQQNNKQLS